MADITLSFAIGARLSEEDVAELRADLLAGVDGVEDMKVLRSTRLGLGLTETLVNIVISFGASVAANALNDPIRSAVRSIVKRFAAKRGASEVDEQCPDE